MPSINELENFNISDAVKFHDRLNPALWIGEELKENIREQLLKIAEDFVSYLGVKDLDIKDITISGSNAAFSYTKHSDLDLHVIVDIDKLPNDEIYRELFNAKKTLYNDSHDIVVKGVPVELYIQDSNEPHVSLGEFSVMNNKWTHIPKRRKANFDEAATKAKFETLKKSVELALKTRDLDRVEKVLSILKRYRRAGLDRAGEFGPENLAYKAIRKQGGLQDLFDLKNELRSEKLSIEEAIAEQDNIFKQMKANGKLEPLNETTEESQYLNVIADKIYEKLEELSKVKHPGILSQLVFPEPTRKQKNKQNLEYGMPHGVLLKNLGLPDVNNSAIKHLIDTIKITVNPKIYYPKIGNIDTAVYYPEYKVIKLHTANIEAYASQNGLDTRYVTISSIVHELQHALDDAKSNGKVFNNRDYSTYQEYLRLPFEINARFQQALKLMSNLVAKQRKGEHQNLTLTNIINDAFDAYRLSGIMQKDSRQYKRLVSRTYKFFTAEHNSPKQEQTYKLFKRAVNYILEKPTSEIKEEQLTELADNPYRYMLSKKTPGSLVYNFQTTAGHLYRVTIILGDESDIQVHFDLREGNSGEYLSGKENTGDSIRVLSTVGKITLDAVNKLNPNKVIIVGDNRDPSRVKLYRALARRMTKLLPDYSLVSDEQQGSYLVITLSKSTKLKEDSNEKLKYYKNPSPIALYNLTQRSRMKHMRGLYHDGNTYWWDGSEMIHAYAAPFIGIPYDYLCRLNAVIGYMSGNYNVDGDEGVPKNIVQRYDFHNNDFTDEELMEDKSSVVYHVTPTKNIPSIMRNGLIPQVGNRSSQIDGEEEGIYVFPTLEDLEDAHWLWDEFDEDEELSVLEINADGLPVVDSSVNFEKIIKAPVSSDRIKVSSDILLETEITNTPDLRIYKNLTPSRLKELTLDKHWNHTRGLYYNGDTYWWDGWGTDHQEASYIMGIEKEDYRRIHAEVVGGVYQVYTEDKGIPERVVKRYNIIDVDELVTENTEGNNTSVFDKIKNSLGLKQLLVTERGNDLILDSLIVGKENQGKGLGSAAMKALTDYADRVGKRIILTPGVQDKNHGTTSRTRLVRFYKQFGFKENKGRTLDYAMGAGKMYRDPKTSVTEASGYIPSEKEKNDPRFKTALTVDVNPNSIKNNAKAFGFKISRAGIPPQARANGKLLESAGVDPDYFMSEGCGVFAYALWIANGKPAHNDIMIISNVDGEPWFGDESSDEPTHEFEATHVYYDCDVLGPVDVRGPRSVKEMIEDFGIHANVEGPYDPVYFKNEWMGNTDNKPLWFDEQTLQEALEIINQNRSLYLGS